MTELTKHYDPKEIEQRLYKDWEVSGAFRPVSKRTDTGQAAKPFVIVMPPPNVTGSLHIGHGLTFTLQDVLIRYHRKQGRDVLHQAGTDHAGIATQMVVERQLAENGETRDSLGRDAFLEKIWDWKAKSGNTIVHQLKRLGISADWSRECFTMDAGPSRAVRRAFVKLYNDGLIYRSKRLVNWDPKLLTAISDLEVIQKEVKGKLYRLAYPLVNNPDQTIVVATTRPETMLGDTAVAVHPEDERYAALIGELLAHPLTGREIPIVADEYAKPEEGTGAVKMTPAHDFNDFAVGQRHNLETLSIMDSHARLNEAVPKPYQGLDREVARERVIADLESLGLYQGYEDITHTVPYGDRSGVPVEPMLTDQWFVNAKPLAEHAATAVRNGRTEFVPKQWENTYFSWLDNIQPWCISRQIWWGHQIPCWYAPDGTLFVAETIEDALSAAHKKFGFQVELKQDKDVLDTWFSSALWPFSTMGWPDEDANAVNDMARFYPGSVLVTGFDIIFFWVARMMMASLWLLDDIPFEKVYVHALVRDEHGQKMSKSKGNVIDPLSVCDEYGTDALRLALVSLAAQGRDIRLGMKHVETYRNFATKLWNAARFCQMNQAVFGFADFNPAQVTHDINRWVVGETVHGVQAVATAIEAYRFNDAAREAYAFMRNSVCDHYFEFSKVLLASEDEDLILETRQTMGWVLDCLLHTLHPIAPFVTEELWGTLAARSDPLILARWPEMRLDWVDVSAKQTTDWLIEVITAIRSVRSELGIAPSVRLTVTVRDTTNWQQAALKAYGNILIRQAFLESLNENEAHPVSGSVEVIASGARIILNLAGQVDFEKEAARLEKAIKTEQKDIDKLVAKLKNESFLSRAPANVIEEQKARLARHEDSLTKLQSARNRITFI